MPGGDSTDALERTFRLVANEIRLEILQVLWDVYTDDSVPEPEPVQFSTLRERVGVRDPGQFHYHLEELVPQFVTDHDEGYTLTYAGAQIVGAGISGVYTDTDLTFGPRALDECSQCGSTLQLHYEQGHAVVECEGCDARRVMSAPPILVAEHDVAENPELLGTFTTTQLQQTARGFCFLCSGPVEGAVADSSLEAEADASLEADAEGTGSVKVVYECTECGAPFYTAAVAAVLDHPAAVSLLHDAGIDYREIPSWAISRTLDAEERVLDDDPPRVRVTMTDDDDELTLVLDETLDVIEYDRS